MWATCLLPTSAPWRATLPTVHTLRTTSSDKRSRDPEVQVMLRVVSYSEPRFAIVLLRHTVKRGCKGAVGSFGCGLSQTRVSIFEPPHSQSCLPSPTGRLELPLPPRLPQTVAAVSQDERALTRYSTPRHHHQSPIGIMSPPASAATASESNTAATTTTTVVFEEDTREEVSS